MWIFRRSVIRVDSIGCNEVYEIGYYIMNSNPDTAGFRHIFTVDSLLNAIRLVNYLNGGDGTINSMIEDICGE